MPNHFELRFCMLLVLATRTFANLMSLSRCQAILFLMSRRGTGGSRRKGEGEGGAEEGEEGEQEVGKGGGHEAG